MSAAINYNRIWNDQTYNYLWGTQPTSTACYALTKDYASQQLSAIYQAPKQWKLDFGVTNTFNRYHTDDRLQPENPTTRQTFYRGNIYAFASKTWNERLTLRLGAGASYVNNGHLNKAMFEPNFSFNYHSKGKPRALYPKGKQRRQTSSARNL